MKGIRTTPVAVGTEPYAWNIEPEKIYQCVWYAYYRCLEKGLPAPCWYDGSGDHGYGAYTNAKEWLNNYRTPWIPYSIKDYPNYVPVENDIVVYDGKFGHVRFMETDTMYSEYSSGDPNSFKNGKYMPASNILGFLHYPNSIVQPVERNEEVNQIQTTDTALRIRNNHNLSAEVIGYVQIGYYNVLDSVEEDGYTWYKLADGMWCANVSTIYLPSESTDIIKEIERYFDSMKERVNTLSEENRKIRADMNKINEISNGWKL